MKKMHFAAALAAIALPLAAMPAHAETAQLRYDDLDLATEAGKAELSRRIDTVAQKACPLESITGSRIQLRDEQARCMADVRRQIASKLGDQLGNAIASAKR
ncbi:MAG: UrcA family protein [Novosphingobium sp.]